MATIKAPNPHYSGLSAGVQFDKGVGKTDDPRLIAWFIDRGYQVEDPQEDPPEEPLQVLVKPAPRPDKKRKGE